MAVLSTVGLLVASCGPIGPGEVPEDLAGLLLTVEDVGGDFAEEYRGTVAFDVSGSLCPAGRERAAGALDVLSSESTSGGALFASPPERTGSEPGDTLLQHFVLTADADEIAAAMAELRAGFEECYGTTWRVEDLEYTVEPLDVPDVGEESFGVFLRHFADIPTVYIHKGEIFTIVAVEEVPDPDASPKITGQELDRIVEAAARRLPA